MCSWTFEQGIWKITCITAQPIRRLADNVDALDDTLKAAVICPLPLGSRECHHIGSDFLLIYNIDDGVGKSGTIYFVRAGTYSELFK
jgi:mRNA-degrading endonuclease YafQ of YafQ-DinJ toxin-antitoxin module